MKVRDFVLLYVNGMRTLVKGERAFLMLADFLRTELHLVGTKIVCAEGDCGACSVLRYFPKAGSTEVVYEPINSCITTVAQMDGSSLVTVEGLEDESGRVSPVQKSMLACHGSQCGFCTPGFVVALTGMMERKCLKQDSAQIDSQAAKNALTGNLCRCTGYQPIIDAAKELNPSKHERLASRYFSSSQKKDLLKTLKEPISIKTDRLGFEAPVKETEAAKIFQKSKETKIFSGGTDLGVGINKGRAFPELVLSLHLIPSLYKMKKTGSRLWVGARVTLEEVRRKTEKLIPEFSSFLNIFASPQIKNTGTLIGNLANASPIGDTLPFLLVSGTQIHVQGVRGKRKIPIEKFWKGYRSTDLKKGEFILGVYFEISSVREVLKLEKISQRKDLDISAINAAFRIEIHPKSRVIQKVRLALGGVGPTPLRLLKTEKTLLGKKLDARVLVSALKVSKTEITPQSDLRGSSSFRKVLSERLLGRFLEERMRDS